MVVQKFALTIDCITHRPILLFPNLIDAKCPTVNLLQGKEEVLRWDFSFIAISYIRFLQVTYKKWAIQNEIVLVPGGKYLLINIFERESK